MKRKAITACLLALPLAVTAAPPSKDGGGPSEVQVVNDATAPIPVEVTSMPAPSGTADVNVVNGSLNVNVNDSTPIQVQVTNQPSGTSNVNVVGTTDVNVVGGTVSVDDSAPIQVEVTNPSTGGGCASSDYVFAGWTEGTINQLAPSAGGVGFVGAVSLCESEFGTGARPAFYSEAIRTPRFDNVASPKAAFLADSEWRQVYGYTSYHTLSCFLFGDNNSGYVSYNVVDTRVGDFHDFEFVACGDNVRLGCSVPVCPLP